MNQAIFQRNYPGIQAVLNEIIQPIFGETAMRSEDIIANNDLGTQAAAAGINKITRIAEYTLDGTPFNIFDVEIKDTVDIGRNRVNIKRLLVSKLDVFSSSLMFFHYADPTKEWRISYVAKGGSNKETTAAKRYTFLCGVDQHCKTVTERFNFLEGKHHRISASDLTNAFSVAELNKEFYKDLSNWYFWAMQTATFPEGENAEPLIRLITRTIFVWFMRKKDLIPDDFFDKKTIEKWLEPDVDASSYYKAILQNLFFATLNTDMKVADSRIFRTQERHRGGYNSDYQIFSVYRYEDFFTSQGKVDFLERVKTIPFLNGGLFACLDANEDNTVIDAFSDKPCKRKMLTMPNELFWAEESIVDLSAIYDDPKRNREKVIGLIPLLSQYNFTVDESSKDEATVALDPELLGMVFENLLASYNPETATTARKQTGSFYTPREIVDYMVEESVIQHILTATASTDINEDKIRELVSTDDRQEFSKPQKQAIIKAIENCKILDPACGSGAFPIGLLQNLVHVLEKLDPVGSTKDLYERKLQIIQNCIYGVDIQPIAVQISKLRCFISLLAEDELDDAKDNRGIEPLPNLEMHFVAANSLIDVDIDDSGYLFSDCETQNLIAELSLIREEFFTVKKHSRKKQLQKEDANARTALRVRLESLASKGNADKIAEIATHIRQLEEEQKLYLGENWEYVVNPQPDFFEVNDNGLIRVDTNAKKREEITATIKSWRKDLTKLQSVKVEHIQAEAAKLADWNPYNQMKASPFFNPRWMFGNSDGFDIVIGNPPYSQVKKNTFSKAQFPYSEGLDEGKQNLYKIFIEHSYNTARTDGVICLIVQSSILGDLSATFSRKLLLEKTTLRQVIEFPKKAPSNMEQVFASVLQGTCIIFFEKTIPQNTHLLKISHGNNKKSITNPIFCDFSAQVIYSLYPQTFNIPLVRPSDYPILLKIKNIGQPLGKFAAKVRQGDLNLTTNADDYSQLTSDVKLFRGRNIQRYFFNFDVSEYLTSPYDDYTEKIIENQSNIVLACQEISGTCDVRRLIFSALLSNEKIIFAHTTQKIILHDNNTAYYILGILNSKFMDWYFRKTSTNNHVAGYEIEQLPIPNLPYSKHISKLVQQVLELKNQDPSTDTSALEAQIDALVYALYDLTPAEIAIIEDSTKCR